VENLGQKLFEVYSMNHAHERAGGRATLPDAQRHFAGNDAVIVADYGHGSLSCGDSDHLRKSVLTVNTQSNAGNHGFNLISNIRADYVCSSVSCRRFNQRAFRR
jgi:hypothetical protein